jgi:hypothetical protein
MKQLRVWLLMVAFAAIPGAALAAKTAPGPAPAPACAPGAPLTAYTALLKSPQTPTESVTRFLPDDTTAKLYFHHTLSNGTGGPTDNFAVFESPWPAPIPIFRIPIACNCSFNLRPTPLILGAGGYSS